VSGHRKYWQSRFNGHGADRSAASSPSASGVLVRLRGVGGIDMKCGTCKYIEKDEDHKFEGLCRRFPPVLRPCGPGFGFTFPQMDLRKDWCGEHAFEGGKL